VACPLHKAGHNYGKMAEVTTRELVLNSVLCFVASKFGKMDLKQLKGILPDFYSADNVSVAKKQLLHDAGRAKLDGILSRYPERHGDSRTVREVDDILNIVQQLDEQKSLCGLPCYVTDNAEAIPSVKLDDGDLQLLLVKFNKMESELQSLRTTVHTLASTVDKLAINTRSTPITTPADAAWPSLRQAAAASSRTQPQNNHAACTYRSPQVGFSTNASVRISDVNRDDNRELSTWSRQVDSADAVCSDVADSNDNDSDGYTRVESRRSRRAKKRKLASPNVDGSATDSAARGGPTDDRADRPAAASKSSSTRRPLLIGKRPAINSGSSSDCDCGFAAAKPRKLVVCVDNVGLNFDENAVKAFVSNIGVRVLSCFKVKPRLAAWQRELDKPVDHNTFRLCINSADKNLLLNSDAWPEDIIITKYFFKSSNRPVNVTAGTAAVNQNTEFDDNSIADNTILCTDYVSASTPQKTL